MFTGLVTDVGTIERVQDSAAGRELTVRCAFSDLADGESVALDGVCLTVRDQGDGQFVVAAAAPTLARTTLDEWRAGRRVNLERALRASDRLGGHIVQGHVDAVGAVAGVRRQGDAMIVELSVPAELEALLVQHGSVAVNGVSLTVNALPAPGVAQLMLIEYTLRHTNLGELQVGTRVNIEADIIGKYVQRLVGPHARTA